MQGFGGRVFVVYHCNPDIGGAGIVTQCIGPRSIFARQNTQTGFTPQFLGDCYAAALRQDIEPQEKSAGRPGVAKMCADDLISKFELADQIIGTHFGYTRPAGGFFLWLDVLAQGGSVTVAEKLWREAGLRVLPGEYAAWTDALGHNPGAAYIRIAMVHDKDTTAEALHRLIAVLG